jgi:signal transduction histidine kinase
VAPFVVAGLVVTVALAVTTGVLARRAGQEQALRSVQQLTTVTAAAVLQSLDTGACLDQVAGSVLRREAATLRRAGPVTRVEVSDGAGRVLWSDDSGRVGRVVPLDRAQQRALHSGSGNAVVSAGRGVTLLEAFVGIRDSHGRPLLVGLFQRDDTAPALARATWLRFAPAALGALLFLQLVQVPLGWRLARRLRRSEQAQAALVQSAADASEAERRRIAGHVHDHAVQDLTALAYELDVARLRAAGGDRDGALTQAAGRLRGVIADLRALLVSLVPTRVAEAGLGPALAALGADLERSGTRAVVDTTGVEEVPEPAAAVLYRCAREALRNAAAHSGAGTVELTIRCDERDATMTVEDDGRGFDGELLAERQAEGHLGLRALGELFADAGGTLLVTSAPGEGTRMVATVPLRTAAVHVGPAR